MDNNICPNCGAAIPDGDDFCGSCGTHRIELSQNYCINKLCERYKQPLDNLEQMYCGKCGKLTAYGNKIEKLT